MEQWTVLILRYQSLEDLLMLNRFHFNFFSKPKSLLYLSFLFSSFSFLFRFFVYSRSFLFGLFAFRFSRWSYGCIDIKISKFGGLTGTSLSCLTKEELFRDVSFLFHFFHYSSRFLSYPFAFHLFGRFLPFCSFSPEFFGFVFFS